jgi:TPR repeat protein
LNRIRLGLLMHRMLILALVCLALPAGTALAQTPVQSPGQGGASFWTTTPAQKADAERRAPLLQAAAERGVAGAMVEFGFALLEGRGVRADRAKAAEWFRKAADKGSNRALDQLSLMYRTGEGVPRDKAEARRLYSEMWRRCREGETTDINPVMARNCHEPPHRLSVGAFPLPDLERVRAAAADGDTEAMRALAYMHADYGRSGFWDVAYDPVESRRWTGRAADMGDVAAMKMLANWSRFGFPDGRPIRTGGPPDPDVDYKQALIWFERAGEAGDIQAMLTAADFYLDDKTTRDPAAAERWLRRAMDAGSLTAAYTLGMSKQNGRGGIAKDDAGGLALLTWVTETGKDTDNEVRWAANWLATAYRLGRGVKANPVLAASWQERFDQALAADTEARRPASEQQRRDNAAWRAARDAMWLPEKPVR